MEDIANIRKDIDAIDDSLFALLKKRLALVSKLGKHKAIAGKDVTDLKREEEVLNRMQQKAKEEGISSSFITSLWTRIFIESKNVQEENYE